jgi:transcription termination/antitermination protein NusA
VGGPTFFIKKIMAITEFNLALNQVASERGIPVENIIASIKDAMATAFRKDRKEHGEEIILETIEVDLDQMSGEVKILMDGADVTPAGFGRIAAQTAKQVILQKIRETEKELVFKEYTSKAGEIVIGTIFRVDNGNITLDLGKSHAQASMPYAEQVSTEQYRGGQKIKVLVKEVRETSKGPEIIVSRSDPKFVAKLFEQEVPEIAAGTVSIEAISREPGSRTKMAVYSRDDKVDPVGSCVGQKGVRVQSIITELFGEKIDIIPFSFTTEKFIAASLSPAKVTEVILHEEDKRAEVSVPMDQQSLAIGKDGQNARLANKLTRWKIDIKGVENVFSSTDSEFVSAGKGASKVVGVWDMEIKKSQEGAVSIGGDDDSVVDNNVTIEVEEVDLDDTNDETTTSK